jgi:protocatechuate 3,4-dioxygenase beta subunit
LGLLFNPGESQLELEKNRVVIYDRLKSSDIDRALEEQFDRVGSMMFVTRIVTDEEGQPVRDEDTGELVFEDDGC